jgi:hypothetical protein
MLLGELLTTLATKVGIDNDNESLKNISTSISTLEIDDETANSFTSRLLTEVEAKNNPAIKAKFFSEFSDGLDKQLLTEYKGVGLSDETIQEVFSTEPKTSKRISLLNQKIKDVIDTAKKAGANKSEIESLELKYKEQVQQALSEANQLKSINSELLQKSIDREIDWNFDLGIGKHKISESIPSEYRGQLAKQVVKEFLTQKDAKTVLVDGKIKLKRLSDESLEVTDLDFDTAISKALAEKNLLHVAPNVQPIVTQVTPSGQSQGQSTFQKNLELSKNS